MEGVEHEETLDAEDSKAVRKHKMKYKTRGRSAIGTRENRPPAR
jgi:hypothetical protein